MKLDKHIQYFEKIKGGINPDREPGFCSAIIQDGKIVHAINHGLASMEHQVPLTGDSLFYLASESKQFTAACILHLISDKKLSLKQDVREIVKEASHFRSKITIQNLLNHTSGIPDYFQYLDCSLDLVGGHENDYFDNSHIMKIIDNCEPTFKPNTRHEYSNSNYIILAQIVKHVSGTQLASYAKKHIFKPLKMSHSVYDIDRCKVIRNRVASYTKSKNAYRVYLKNSCTVGDGGLLSSINDLIKWEVNCHDNKHLPLSVVKGLTRRSKLSNGKLLTYANGLEVTIGKDKQEYSFHGGGFGGFITDIIRVPSQKISVIYLSNNEGVGYTNGWYHKYF
ncbi:MAG: serine hydrolase domain-containing protein [Granulosicoccus sp.]